MSIYTPSSLPGPAVVTPVQAPPSGLGAPSAPDPADGLSPAPVAPSANLPAPARWEVADLLAPLGVLVVGAAVLVVALLAVGHRGAAPRPAPGPVVLVPGLSAGPVGTRPAAVLATPSAGQQRQDLARFAHTGRSHIAAAWLAGFYPLYSTAAGTFNVNWLLIASVHKQETAFSTAPSTYRGLNFAGCCGGPMQFNVTNGPVTTWSRVGDAFRFAARPPAYPHATRSHPSIYDDFDSIMAAGRLLAANGARSGLDADAWQAAYAYYGHDATGVTYADQVLARAISWSQRGFCINCGLDPAMVAAVHAAYGAPALAALGGLPAG